MKVETTTMAELVELAYETARELKISCGGINPQNPGLPQIDQAIVEATRAIKTLRDIKRKVGRAK